jgi:arylsulfatase
MVIRWPAKIKPDATPRAQFHHVNDLVPTIYEIVGITPPQVVNGIPQDPIDGVSFAYSFDDATASGRLLTQYFEIMGSRAIYHDGWMASAFGPREPWSPGAPKGGPNWTPDDDIWELYNLDTDWSQAKDLAAAEPEKLAQMKELFAMEAARNKVYPVGGGLWVPAMHPELRIAPSYTEWDFAGTMTRMPEFCAPTLGNKPNLVTIDADIPPNANGVLYKLGGAGGGLTCYVDDGEIVYEYNLFIIQRTKIRSAGKLPTGQVKIEVETVCETPAPGGPLRITIRANDAVLAQGRVPMSAPLCFSANDCLDIGRALGSPPSLDYYDRAPFPFSGKIHHVNVRYIAQSPPTPGDAVSKNLAQAAK